jgi:hypothetical protein
MLRFTLRFEVHDIGHIFHCRSNPSHLLRRLEEIHVEIRASARLLQRERLLAACTPDPISLGL